MKKIHFPHSRFTFLFAAWLVSLVVNILLSEAPTISIMALNPLSGLTNPTLPLFASWPVTISSFGASLKNVFFGTGLGNFGNAFTAFRPISFNTEALWFFRFDRASSPVLTTLVEQGLIGLFFWCALFYLIYKTYLVYKDHDQEFFFNKQTRRLIKGFFILIGIWFIVFFLPLPYSVFPLISPISLISLILVIFFFAKNKLTGFHRISLSYLALPISLITFIALMTLFIIFSPRISPDRFLTQSQVMLAIAEKTAKTNPKDKKTISNQVALAIAAANQAINLNPKNSAYQINLAMIAARLNNILTDAPRLAMDHFQKALILDPANPQLFFEIGRFQFTKGDLYSANQNFQRATELKKDYAPAWFAVYQTEKQLGDIAAVSGNVDLQKKHEESAKFALSAVEKLVCDDDSEDCVKVKKAKQENSIP
jgi:tetratricopeptide (TPR) repeat protein